MQKRETLLSFLSPFLTILFFFFFHLFYITAGFLTAQKLISFFHHIVSADRTFFIRRLLPWHEITFRIIFAAVILTPLLRFFQYHFFSAFWTGNAYFFVIRLCIPALRKSRTCEKSPVRSIFDHHVSSDVYKRQQSLLLIYNIFFEFSSWKKFIFTNFPAGCNLPESVRLYLPSSAPMLPDFPHSISGSFSRSHHNAGLHFLLSVQILYRAML